MALPPHQYSRGDLLDELLLRHDFTLEQALKAIDLAVSKSEYAGHGVRIEFLHSGGGRFTLEEYH